MLKSALSVLLFSCLLGPLDCTVNKQETVKSGENATLQCYSSTGAAVSMLMWRNPDLQSELEEPDKQLYVLYIRENLSYEIFQLPSFKGRVQLRDPQMKDGDLSVIIKNLSMNDAGIYECYAGYDKEDPQLMSSTNLTVEEPGPTGGTTEDGGKKSDFVGIFVSMMVTMIISSVLFCVLRVFVIACCISIGKCLNLLKSNYRCPADQVL
ncbi:uncharacterized protein LOC115777418 [Archocentrus centrarchus]|uniref:uncharacterized protein LOC115777418 n=1 Tax=Archocentrus centrarchus TaxID=63155 RepID=UPI0011E9E17F|nr:uncharacterized protein LOC115777418 [Archocentrus centrarchus]